VAPDVPYEQFRKEWLAEIEGLKTTVERGRRFCLKLIAHRFDVDEADDLPNGVVYCDGSKDGGIDLAYLDAHDPDDADGGDTWYLVQSKYGTALKGEVTILAEGRKVIDTLNGQRERLSSVSADVMARVAEFRKRASPRDRLVLLMATTDELTAGEKKALDDVRTIGRQRLGALFDVEHVSLRSVYEAGPTADAAPEFTLRARLAPSGDNLLVGTVALDALYEFLEAYRAETKELDRIFERNVRRFLGNRGKVNQGIERTLDEEPERFGLFNNGITFVVSEFALASGGSARLVNPYIVNGCQTTRTVWNVFDRKLNSGGTADNPELDEWQQRTAKGVVVAKVVRVSGGNERELQKKIIRSTNMQNAVADKDFLALTDGLAALQQEMERRVGVYLEVEKGGWDAMRVRMRERPGARQFAKQQVANHFELMKVYGAGWLGVPGVAFGQNKAFTLGGRIYQRIRGEGRDLDASDLFAAFRLKQLADERKFGRGAKKESHKLTRFLFYFTVCELLRAVLAQHKRPAAPPDLTRALLALFDRPGGEVLFEWSEGLIEDYMRDRAGSLASVFDEPRMLENTDPNAFLKWERVGHDSATADEPCPCPMYRKQIELNRLTLNRQVGKQPSGAEQILAALQQK
jgi:hypothetical protein